MPLSDSLQVVKGFQCVVLRLGSEFRPTQRGHGIVIKYRLRRGSTDTRKPRRARTLPRVRGVDILPNRETSEKVLEPGV